MSGAKTKKCIFCHETIPFGATRCKACGSTLPESKRNFKKYLTLLFFVTTILFAVLFFTWTDHLERERNRNARLEERNAELEELLEECYRESAAEPIENYGETADD